MIKCQADLLRSWLAESQCRAVHGVDERTIHEDLQAVTNVCHSVSSKELA